MIRSIPTINTARLALRAMRPEDFDRYAEIWDEPRAMRNLAGPGSGRRRAWEAFLRDAGHWQMTGFGQWAVIEQRSRRMIRQAGFFYGATPLGEEFDSFAQAGWLMVPEADGSGMAVEAVQAAHDWFDRVIPGRLVARVPAACNASCALARRLGYVEKARAENEATLLLRRDGPPGAR